MLPDGQAGAGGSVPAIFIMTTFLKRLALSALLANAILTIVVLCHLQPVPYYYLGVVVPATPLTELKIPFARGTLLYMFLAFWLVTWYAVNQFSDWQQGARFIASKLKQRRLPKP